MDSGDAGLQAREFWHKNRPRHSCVPFFCKRWREALKKATVATWRWSQITWIKSVRALWKVQTKHHDGAGALQKK